MAVDAPKRTVYVLSALLPALLASAAGSYRSPVYGSRLFTKFWQIRACSTGACLEPFPYCSLGIRLDRPEQAHHDGRAGPPDPHGEEEPSMKIGESPCPAEMHALKPTNLSQSQLSNNRPPKPPDYPYKRRLTWSLPLFSAASRTRPWPLQDWARAPLYLSMCCVFNSDS